MQIREVDDRLCSSVVRERDMEPRTRLLVALDPCAPAVGLGALWSQHRDPDGVTVVLPADHLIEPLEDFSAALRGAAEITRQRPGAIVVFGIPARHPETGYGYVERGRPIADFEGRAAYEVQSFREKPDLETARRYVASGEYFWNAGMFCFRSATMLERIAEHLPELAAGLERLRPALGGEAFAAELARLYPTLEKQSIDYGVLEVCSERVVLETDFAWDDVGSWPALARHRKADADGNFVTGEVVSLDASGNIVDAGGGLVALIGVRDLIVVRTDDVTLVCRAQDAERVKELVQKVRDPRFL